MYKKMYRFPRRYGKDENFGKGREDERTLKTNLDFFLFSLNPGNITFCDGGAGKEAFL